jgi:hypothetical protein
MAVGRTTGQLPYFMDDAESMAEALMRIEHLLRPSPAKWLALGAMALYAGALLASWAGRSGRCTAGQRALLNWGLIGIVCWVVRALGWPEMAQRILFGTSVAVLLLGIGSAALVHPAGLMPQRRGWIGLWMLATTLMVFLVGFYGFALWRGAGVVLWRGAAPLVIEGLVVLSLWQEPEEFGEVAAKATAAKIGQWDGGEPKARWNGANSVEPWLVLLVWGLAAGMVGCGGWAATQGAQSVRLANDSVSIQAIAGTLLSAALVLPMLRSSRTSASPVESRPWRRQPLWNAMGPLMGIVFLNLCALLPSLALWPYLRTILPALPAELRGWGLQIDWSHFQPLVFPYACWRIDAVALLLGSLLLLPAWMGKWKLGRAEGVMLVGGYLVYVLLTLAGVRG